jgi:hypothetical protein
VKHGMGSCPAGSELLRHGLVAILRGR